MKAIIPTKRALLTRVGPLTSRRTGLTDQQGGGARRACRHPRRRRVMSSRRTALSKPVGASQRKERDAVLPALDALHCSLRLEVTEHLPGHKAIKRTCSRTRALVRFPQAAPRSSSSRPVADNSYRSSEKVTQPLRTRFERIRGANPSAPLAVNQRSTCHTSVGPCSLRISKTVRSAFVIVLRPDGTTGGPRDRSQTLRGSRCARCSKGDVFHRWTLGARPATQPPQTSRVPGVHACKI